MRPSHNFQLDRNNIIIIFLNVLNIGLLYMDPHLICKIKFFSTSVDQSPLIEGALDMCTCKI